MQLAFKISIPPRLLLLMTLFAAAYNEPKERLRCRFLKVCCTTFVSIYILCIHRLNCLIIMHVLSQDMVQPCGVPPKNEDDEDSE